MLLRSFSMFTSADGNLLRIRFQSRSIADLVSEPPLFVWLRISSGTPVLPVVSSPKGVRLSPCRAAGRENVLLYVLVLPFTAHCSVFSKQRRVESSPAAWGVPLPSGQLRQRRRRSATAIRPAAAVVTSSSSSFFVKFHQFFHPHEVDFDAFRWPPTRQRSSSNGIRRTWRRGAWDSSFARRHFSAFSRGGKLIFNSFCPCDDSTRLSFACRAQIWKMIMALSCYSVLSPSFFQHGHAMHIFFHFLTIWAFIRGF